MNENVDFHKISLEDEENLKQGDKVRWTAAIWGQFARGIAIEKGASQMHPADVWLFDARQSLLDDSAS